MSKILKHIRIINNVTQVEIAKYFDINKSSICEIESGKRSLTLQIIERYSKFFKIPNWFILFLIEQFETNKENFTIKIKFNNDSVTIKYNKDISQLIKLLKIP